MQELRDGNRDECISGSREEVLRFVRTEGGGQ
jgi:hypothetical protein